MLFSASLSLLYSAIASHRVLPDNPDSWWPPAAAFLRLPCLVACVVLRPFWEKRRGCVRAHLSGIWIL